MGTTESALSTPAIMQNYPNPFSISTTIPVNLTDDAEVSIALYDLTGRRVSSVYSGSMNAGLNNVSFNRNSISSGTYIYIVNVVTAEGAFQESRKMVIQ